MVSILRQKNGSGNGVETWVDYLTYNWFSEDYGPGQFDFCCEFSEAHSWASQERELLCRERRFLWQKHGQSSHCCGQPASHRSDICSQLPWRASVFSAVDSQCLYCYGPPVSHRCGKPASQSQSKAPQWQQATCCEEPVSHRCGRPCSAAVAATEEFDPGEAGRTCRRPDTPVCSQCLYCCGEPPS